MWNGLILTRHAAAASWIHKTVRVPDMPICQEMDESRFASIIAPSADPITDVFGVLPLEWQSRLQAHGIRVWTLEMTVPLDMRGKELSIEAMDAFGARLVRYDVRVLGIWPE
jgi:putative CRISPR-associated protein (TIGR02620 family)